MVLLHKVKIVTTVVLLHKVKINWNVHLLFLYNQTLQAMKLIALFLLNA